MISKWQMEHLLRFMQQHPSLSNSNIHKGDLYTRLWKILSDYLNYLAQKNIDLVKNKEEWIEFWDDLLLEVKRKVFSFQDLTLHEQIVLDIATSDVKIPDYLLKPDPAIMKNSLADGYFYHNGPHVLSKQQIDSLHPILKSTYLYSERIKTLLKVHPSFTVSAILDLEKLDTDTISSEEND